MKRVAVLGSTGSIGTNTLCVLEGLRDRFELFGLATGRKWQELAEQSRTFSPRVAVLADAALSRSIPANSFPASTELRFGAEEVTRLASHPDVDVVVAAIVGAAGLESTWAAVEAGKLIALANKETLVVAGQPVTELARRTGAKLLPVDSEHSAIFQALASSGDGVPQAPPFGDSTARRPSSVKRIVLTSSGGPCRGWSRSQLESVTPQTALCHPTWKMGPKITVDSATLMNKALEVIEARWLFDLEASQIEVVVHPQSVVHSLVEFVDGSCIAQLSPPDMKLPIQYALTWPDRCECPGPKMDWTRASTLTFEVPDRELFPALDLGFEVARRGGSCGAVLNAANEVAVDRFLNGTLSFTDIPRVSRSVLDAHDFDPAPGLTDLIRLDAWARQEASRWKSSHSI